MALVTVLKINGFEPARLERVNGGCRWVYVVTTKAFPRLLENYTGGSAFVEPKEFAQKLGLVRTEMYRFLGVPKRGHK